MKLNVQAIIADSLRANVEGFIPEQMKAQVWGLISRGIREAEIDESGHLIFTLTDNTTVDLGKVVGDKGDPGVGFPEVTEADNNKIMRVIDGAWELSAFYSVTANPAGGNTLNI